MSKELQIDMEMTEDLAKILDPSHIENLCLCYFSYTYFQIPKND